MADRISPETPLTDRQLIIHILEHVEDLHAQVSALTEVLGEFGPVLDKWRGSPNGYVGMLRAARELRRGSSGP